MANTSSDLHPQLLGSIKIPNHLLKNSSGLSCDIGGTLAKFAYYAKKSESKDETTTLNLVAFTRENIDEGLQYIKNNFLSVADDNWKKVKVTTTGIGSFQYKEKLIKVLDIEPKVLENLLESDCFVKSLEVLGKHLKPGELLEKMRKSDRIELYKWQQLMVKMLDAAKASGSLKTNMEIQIPTDMTNPEEEKEDNETIQFPCVVMMLGSGGALFQVGEDGKYTFMNVLNQAGRMFTGLGRLLTGAKTFDDLMSLAERGNSDNVDTMTHDLGAVKETSTPETDDSDPKSAKQAIEKSEATKKDSNENTETFDFYESMVDEQPNQLVYSFGKCVSKDKDDFKTEDIARTLLSNMCLSLVQMSVVSAQASGLHNLYICGNFISHPLIRQEISKASTAALKMNSAKNGPMNLSFVNHGGYLGAIGALLFAQE
ncbi:unnamed protein product [Owenia fusiformis]|uniref:Uncharacterized protein n=1 Tax=Owenia fusiformis TaxID=6347 RepID=A0A8J1XT26_OWEFU|nr:unnamed protein product [Owenia fusiformis]